jgi:DNA helicase-4
MSIIKCDQCKDGYLIVKEGKKMNGETNERYSFLGCTKYTQDGRGCNRMMTYKQYRALINSVGSFYQ